LKDFIGWPLLPLRGGRLGVLSPLDRSTGIRPCTGVAWSPAVLIAVETLGCRCWHCNSALWTAELVMAYRLMSKIARVHMHGGKICECYDIAILACSGC
jgi:hypothetical protein